MTTNVTSQYVETITKVDRRGDYYSIAILIAMFLASWAANHYGNWAVGGMAFIAGAALIVHIQNKSIIQMADMMVNNLPSDRHRELMRWIDDNPLADLLDWPGWKAGSNRSDPNMP